MNWFDPRSASKHGFRITVASDWAPIWSYEALMKNDPLAVYGDLLPVLRESDLNIVNVECVFGEKGAPIPKPGPCLRGETESALASLTGVPFHVATLANNHCMDYGPESLAETLEALQRAGIQTVGAGMSGEAASRPLVIETGGFRLGIVNCGEGEACASFENLPGAFVFDPEVQESQIRRLKEECALVLAIFHGGREHAVSPPPYVVKGLRRLAGAGADAVVAHHPHVPQGLERHHGVPIVYSQGNFVFRSGNQSYYQNTGYLVHLDVEGDAAAPRIATVSITPYRLKPEGVFALRGREREEFVSELAAISSHLCDPRAVRHLWDAFADEYGDRKITVIDQLERALAEHRDSPASANARFHHYFGMPAHRDYFENAFRRLKLGVFDTSPQWARGWVNRWKNRQLENR